MRAISEDKPVKSFQQALAKASPEQIPDLLPTILNSVRLIWNLSRFYNTPERITSLLGKLSNEIINRCSSVINLKDIFSGNVDYVMKTLFQSIQAGEQWKQVTTLKPVKGCFKYTEIHSCIVCIPYESWRGASPNWTIQTL